VKALLEFPAIRGIQAGREYYVSMCPLDMVQRVFLFNETGLSPELRAQRQLNRGRVPEMVRYLVDNPSTYVFSALTASIDGEAEFKPNSGNPDDQTGVLTVPWKSKIIINDGQHRRAAIEAALEEAPTLADETIAVVLFKDRGLERCQQMFADLNRYSVRPSRSLSVLYDHRDDQALLARLVIGKVPGFDEIVEMERSSLSPRSKPLFTLSALYTATAALLADLDLEGSDERAALAARFWTSVAAQMPQWDEVRRGVQKSGAMRDGYIHSHGVTLHALGRVGNVLVKRAPADFARLKKLEGLDWRREAPTWEGRAVINGRMSKTSQSVTLTANVIKAALDLPLSADEQVLEDTFRREQHGQ